MYTFKKLSGYKQKSKQLKAIPGNKNKVKIVNGNL